MTRTKILTYTGASLGQSQPTQITVTKPYLEVRAGDTASQLPEKRLHDFDKLSGINDVQYLLHLTKVHDLLWTVSLWPKLEQTHHHLPYRVSE